MHITIIDNYDSFTYNLVHYFEEFDVEVSVFKNDEIDWNTLDLTDAIVLSPGPGLPTESNHLMDVIQKFFYIKPMLGVCLGMQALAQFVGDQLENQHEVKHGISEIINITEKGSLFKGIRDVQVVGLYHSWKISLNESSPFIPTSFSENNVLMSFQHKELPIYGVQFHPESIMTINGKKIIRNFITSIHS